MFCVVVHTNTIGVMYVLCRRAQIHKHTNTIDLCRVCSVSCTQTRLICVMYVLCRAHKHDLCRVCFVSFVHKYTQTRSVSCMFCVVRAQIHKYTQTRLICVVYVLCRRAHKHDRCHVCFVSSCTNTQTHKHDRSVSCMFCVVHTNTIDLCHVCFVSCTQTRSVSCMFCVVVHTNTIGVMYVLCRRAHKHD